MTGDKTKDQTEGNERRWDEERLREKTMRIEGKRHYSIEGDET